LRRIGLFLQGLKGKEEEDYQQNPVSCRRESTLLIQEYISMSVQKEKDYCCGKIYSGEIFENP
jgi:hypothetical protein